MVKKPALVVCPGRGTYNKDGLGYLKRHHPDKRELIAMFDARRTELGQETLSDLDGAGKFTVSRFTSGDNASALIHACAYADFLSIDREKFDIVAVTGNSMGWYIALACAGALDAAGGFEVVNTMGTLMQEALIGGQLLYPFIDEQWREIPGKRDELLALADSIPGLFISIHLGGMIVFAGEEAALGEAERALPPLQGRFPMRLANHAAFHCPLQAPVARKGQEKLPVSLFGRPKLPLIDGRGQIWWPKATEVNALRDYTLGHQVVETYDFTAAIKSGLREFAPEAIIILGPGTTLGGAVAQCLVAQSWNGISGKTEFGRKQADVPVLYSMGMEEQRDAVT